LYWHVRVFRVVYVDTLTSTSGKPPSHMDMREEPPKPLGLLVRGWRVGGEGVDSEEPQPP